MNLWIASNHRIVRNLIPNWKLLRILKWKTQKLAHVLKRLCLPPLMPNHVHEVWGTLPTLPCTTAPGKLTTRCKCWNPGLNPRGYYHIKIQIVCIFNLFYVNSIFIFSVSRCDLCILNKLQFLIEHGLLWKIQCIQFVENVSVSIVFYYFTVV